MRDVLVAGTAGCPGGEPGAAWRAPRRAHRRVGRLPEQADGPRVPVSVHLHLHRAQQRVLWRHLTSNSREPEVLLENRSAQAGWAAQQRAAQADGSQAAAAAGLEWAAIVSEVKLLRGEPQHELSRPDSPSSTCSSCMRSSASGTRALELSQLENRILNQTADMLQLASKYKIWSTSTSTWRLAHNQSEIIAQLEEHCQPVPASGPCPSRPRHPAPCLPATPYSRIISQISTAPRVQSDQNLKVLPPPLPSHPPSQPPVSTDKPSG